METGETKVLKEGIRRRESLDLSSYTFGKIPPQVKDLEEAVLGAMMLETSALLPVLGIIRNPDIFYVNANRLVYQAIANLFAKHAPVDILTVTEELKRLGKLEDVGGAFYVTELTSRIASAANCEYHAKIVREKWVQRERIRIASMAIKAAYEDSDEPMEGLGNDIDNLSNLLNEVSTGDIRTFSGAADKVFSEIAIRMNQPKEAKQVIGYTTGNAALDEIVTYKQSNFIVISGRPGHGKTSLALESVLANAKKFKESGQGSVVYFSLEMSQEELIQKLYAMESGVDIDNIQKGNLTEHEQIAVENARDLIRSLPIHVFDRGDDDGYAMRDISSMCKATKAKYDARMYFVDYLQLVTTEGEENNSKYSNREQEVSKVSRKLKKLAMRLDAPVIGVSALSRKLEDRSGWQKRPNDADLRESGSIEFDANVIIHVFRPDKLTKIDSKLETYTNDGVFNDAGSTFKVVELGVSKHRGSSKLGYLRQSINDGTSVLGPYVAVNKIEYIPTKFPVPKDYYSKPKADNETPEEDLPF